MKVVLLGTGTPNPDPKRSGPALAIITEDRAYVVDFGPGVVRRGIEAQIRPSQMTRGFITHLHSDHTVGYPDFIMTPAVVGRTEPLQVFGPKGLESMTQHILEAYSKDIQERLEGLEPASRDAYTVIAKEISEGGVYMEGGLEVEAFLVDHGGLEAFGYKFSFGSKSIVISGDTRPCKNLIEHAQGCDILIHEVYSTAGFQKRPENWQQYHRAVHTSAGELGDVAGEIEPRLRVLYHQLFWGTSEQDLVAEVSERYDGQVISGRDLDVFE